MLEVKGSGLLQTINPTGLRRLCATENVDLRDVLLSPH